MDDLKDLGPLPESDDNSLLQDESFKALEAALPTDRFVLRPEPQPDAGVDRCIELRFGGRYTNMRAQVQVKGRAEARTNSDGSVSYSADVSNINYLLNGPSPLYVLYLAEGRELRYAWVRDEVNRIETENPAWMRQGTVTLGFSAKLDEAGLRDIHDRIRREARIDREIHDLLSRADVTEKAVHVNLKESKVSDPDQIRDLLLRGGLTLVGMGEAVGVLEAVEKLSSDAKRLPRLLLVRAFAECSLGRYQLASGHLAETTLRAKELSDSDRQLLTLLRHVCDYKAGRITRAEYIERQRRLFEGDESEFGLSRRIDYLWEAILEDGTRRSLDVTLPKLRATVAKVLALQGCSESLRIQARTVLLYGEGVLSIQEFHRDFAVLKSRIAMGRPADVFGVIGRLNADLNRWTDDFNALVEDAFEHGNPHLLGDACYSRSFIMFVRSSSAHVWLKPEAVPEYLERLKAQLMPDLRRAIQCYNLSGHIEWELRAKVLLADVAALTGEDSLARDMADEVLPVAEAYQFDGIAKEARDHLAGDPFFRQMQRQHLQADPPDQDLFYAKLSDELIRQSAEETLELTSLPRDRLGVITREVESFRDIARERIDWCRHIQLIQDLTHIQHPATYYAYDPVRFCCCERYGFSSKIGNTDWRLIIETFKKNYCLDCPSRSPKDGARPPEKVD